MKWSLRLVRFAGFDIRIHVSFVLLIGYVLWRIQPLSIERVLMALLLLVLLFASVTLHELGHALAARFFGIPVKGIVLWPFGGSAHFERTPDKPLHDLLISAAGPFANALIGGITLVLFTLQMSAGSVDVNSIEEILEQPSFGGVTLWLCAVNMALLLFNLIPALPLDGGHMLRAGLLMTTNKERAGALIKYSGWAVAVLLGIIGIATGDGFLITITIVMFIASSSPFAAQDEQAAIQQESRAGNKDADMSENRSAMLHSSAGVITTPLGEITTPSTEYKAERPAPVSAIVEPTVRLAHDNAAVCEQTHWQIILFGVLNLLFAVALLVVCALFGLVLIYGVGFSGDPASEVVPIAIALMLFILGIASGAALFITAGVGLLRRRRWGYVLHLVGAGLLACTLVGLIYSVPAFICACLPPFRTQFAGQRHRRMVVQPAC
jgi:Zn-dependent protease